VLNFDLSTETEGKSVLVTVRGDLDVQVAGRVAEEIARLEESHPELLVLDLSGLSFLDSSGMGVIAAAHGRAVETGRRFYVVNPPPGVRRAFELSTLDQVIDVVDDLASVYP
jgi:stage II sporulation protein AA (anti-sigma F factor antagonist)